MKPDVSTIAAIFTLLVAAVVFFAWAYVEADRKQAGYHWSLCNAKFENAVTGSDSLRVVEFDAFCSRLFTIEEK